MITIFDKFARCVEEFFPNLVPYMQRAKLFMFPGRAHEILPDFYDVEQSQQIIDNFFLPFPVVAVEDTMSCVLLIDEEKEQRGLNCRRHFLEFTKIADGMREADLRTDMGLTGEEKAIYENSLKRVAARHPNLCMISHGILENATITDIDENGNAQIGHTYQMLKIKLCDPGNGSTDMDSLNASPREKKLTIHACVQNAWVAFKEINHFNSPEYFILEEMPKKAPQAAQKAQKLGKIPRRHQRPLYTVLRPTRIRERMGLPSVATGLKKAPHERRAHTRTFRSDKFKYMRGKTIIIPAKWIGPAQSIVGNKIYRVVLDK